MFDAPLQKGISKLPLEHEFSFEKVRAQLQAIKCPDQRVFRKKQAMKAKMELNPEPP